MNDGLGLNPTAKQPVDPVGGGKKRVFWMIYNLATGAVIESSAPASSFNSGGSTFQISTDLSAIIDTTKYVIKKEINSADYNTQITITSLTKTVFSVTTYVNGVATAASTGTVYLEIWA